MKQQAALFVLLLAASWVTMVVTHELGHIAGGWIGGATLADYDLAPWRMPYSVHSPDPMPLLTLWAGPLVGVLIPLVLALVLRLRWAWFIADFCLIANGGYLVLAWLAGDRYLDTPRMLDAGAQPVIIALYCGTTIAIGYVRFRSDCVQFFRSWNSRSDGDRRAGAEQ